MSDLKNSSSGQEEVRDSICYMCTTCCPTKVYVHNGIAVKIDMMDPRVVDTCPRWAAQLDFVYHQDRLKQPLKRNGDRGNGNFIPISWEEALDTVADRLQEIKNTYGAESVVFYIPYPKEPRPYFHRLAHAFGSPNYCTESSNCATAAMLATDLTFGGGYRSAFGRGRAVSSLTRCELAWTSAVRHSAPQLWKDYLAAIQKGLKLIVVDPRRTDVAAIADIHIQLRPGTDGALALGLMNVIINQQLYDREFIARWTVGFDRFSDLVEEYSPQKVAQITWVPAEKIEEAAVLFATQKPARIRTSPGATSHHSNGVQNHRAVILLAALTGNLEEPDDDQTSPRGHQGMNDITLHERVANLPPGLGTDRFPLWTNTIREMQSNVIADRIESATPYPLKALFGAGLNVNFFPNYRRLVQNLNKLDFIIVNEYFHNPGTQLADMVLPIASWLERPMLISPDGRLRLIEAAIKPVGGSWPEWQIYAELAKKLGFGHEFWDGDFGKCLNYMLEPTGVTVADLRRHPEGIKPSRQSKPGKHNKQVGFKTPSGKVEITSSILEQHGHEALPVYKEPPESPLSRPDLLDSFPLVLTSGARTVAYTHSQYRNIPRLRRLVPEPKVEINPADAEPRGIGSGDTVVVSSPRGSIRLKAKVTDTILPGVVHAVHQWPGESNVNILTDDGTLDPISGFAPFKSQLCQVAKS